MIVENWVDRGGWRKMKSKKEEGEEEKKRHKLWKKKLTTNEADRFIRLKLAPASRREFIRSWFYQSKIS